MTIRARQNYLTDGEITDFDYRYDLEDYIEKDPEEIPIEDIKKFYEEYIDVDPVRRTAQYKKYQFYSFYHSQVCTMIKQLNRYGIEGLLNPVNDTKEGQDLLRQQGNNNFSFQNSYAPQNGVVEGPLPEEGFDFDASGPYGVYNWELFFHAPLTIAARLTQNQKFEEAQKWFHYIFNPTETKGDAPARYWKVKPFHEYHGENNINTILKKMSSGDSSFNKQLNQWMKNPFKPHVIARLRTVAYMKSVVMKYLDNLIAWGDQLFKRDSIESINEATQLYILAAQILGPKPTSIAKPDVSVRTVGEILSQADDLSNALVQVESQMNGLDTGDEEEPDTAINSLNSILFFCTSPNDKLLGYWDTVSDRLFKIRNCQNIAGVTRSLALFEPPIDPALLVKAAAAGLDIGTVLNNISGTSLPYYRFRFLVQKALDLCNDVKSLGSTLLSVLEKKDAEDLALLRAGQEIQLLKAIRQVRKQNIKESEENLSSLETAKELIEIRRQYYNIRQYMNPHEEKQLKKIDRALALQVVSQNMGVLAAALNLIPAVTLGVSGAFGSPHAVVKVVDGKAIGSSLNIASNAISLLSQIENNGATKAGIKGGYDRRTDDWQLQTDLATKELEQIEKQITAAQIRLSITERELENQDLQIQQSQDVEALMKDKYTNKELYNWMITQVSAMYFQSYQLAYDVARMAEQAYGYELADENTSFIQFGYWDSLRKGLLSGEKLQRDIRRMEIAYIEQNKREYELTKHISLSLLAPEQLIALRNKGACDINIPEVFFDLDHPGQYMRRIKNVSITIPAVTGPYTNVNAKLTLLSNRLRKTSLVDGDYGYTGINDARFNHKVAGIQSIATSSGQNDAGMFELNFQDERYLPFEGAGAISRWRLELSSEFRQFDYDTIADVILHMNYTARDGGEILKQSASSWVNNGLNLFADELAASDTGMQRVFSLKTHFPNALYQLFQPISGETFQEASIVIKKEHFPHFLASRSLTFADNGLTIMMQLRDGSNVVATDLNITLIDGNDTNVPTPGPLVISSAVPLPFITLGPLGGSPIDTWKLQVSGSDLANKLNSDEVKDIYLVMNYTIN